MVVNDKWKVSSASTRWIVGGGSFRWIGCVRGREIRYSHRRVGVECCLVSRRIEDAFVNAGQPEGAGCGEHGGDKGGKNKAVGAAVDEWFDSRKEGKEEEGREGRGGREERIDACVNAGQPAITELQRPAEFRWINLCSWFTSCDHGGFNNASFL
jgi:hypothetical protein